MKRVLYATALALILAGLGVSTLSAADDKPAAQPSAMAKPDALSFPVKDIDGNNVDLSKYSGKVIMMVNVASKCGNTPQYAGLEKMYEKYKDKGFVLMGFPANNFGGQEPGTNAQIKEFCEETYKVAFPMFSKVSVKGNDIDPLFKYLTSLDSKPLSHGDIAWNFEKFLIGRDGKLVARFANKTQPEDPTVVAAIETAIASK